MSQNAIPKVVIVPDGRRPMRITRQFRAEGYHMDMFGVVTNTVYVRWLDDLRISFLDKYYPVKELMADGYFPTVASTKINYVRPVFFEEVIEGRLWVTKMMQGKWTMQEEFVRDGRVVCKAVQDCYFVDKERLRPAAIPDRLRLALLADLNDD